MARAHPRTVALLSAPGTLEGIDAPLERAGVRLVRLAVVRAEAVDPKRWLTRLARASKLDTAVVTSRHGVSYGIEPWRQSLGTFPTSLEFWGVGPGTAHALRRAGARRVHRPSVASASALGRALERRPPRTVVCFRSNAAGPRLARSLRDQGHHVIDLVVYRIVPPLRLDAAARRALERAELLVATSPSALAGLQRPVDRRTFVRLTRTARLVVLGDRSREAAQRLGFRNVTVAAPTTAQRFTRYLLRELRDGSN